MAITRGDREIDEGVFAEENAADYRQIGQNRQMSCGAGTIW